MNTQKSNLHLLASVPVSRALLSLGLPIMVGMLINALYNLIDAYFVSRLGEVQLGAISVVFPLSQVIVGLGLMFGNGAASYLSRLLGQKNIALANKVATTAVYGSIVTGFFVIVAFLIFLPTLLKSLGATETILPYALAYARIYIASCLFNIFNVTMNNILSSEGAATTALCALLLGAVLNIALDPLLIYVFEFGVVGAAIATLLAQIASTLVYLSFIGRRKSVFSFHYKHLSSSTKPVIGEILKIGVPTLIFQILTSLSISLTNQAAAAYGDVIIASMGVVTRLTTVGTLIVFGFLKGFQPIAGFSYAAHDIARLQKAIHLSLLWSTGFCLLFGLSMICFSHQLISIFVSNNAQMLLAGRNALIANGFSFIFFGFYTVYSFLFLALGKARAGLLLGTCRQGLCFIPVILFFPHFFGINGIIFAQPITDVLSAIITLPIAIWVNKTLQQDKFSTL